MFNPAYKLTIGDKIVDTTNDPQASTLTDLTVALDMNAPADSVTFVFGQVDGLAPERGDEATVEIGYDNSLTQVITATVVAVEPGLTHNRIVSHTATDILLRTFVNNTYESKTAGAIVRDLADQAGVDISNAEDGITFPAYVIDGRRNLYQHMRDLADLCGFDVYINSDGELVFEKFTTGNTIHLFDYSKHIIELDMLQTPQMAEVVEAFGESPGGQQAEEAWAWLTKDFSDSKGVAGTGDSTMLLERSALRTAAAAGTAATAAFTRIQQRSRRGRLLSTGRPEVKLGDAIRVADVPNSSLNGTFQVRGVTHRITKIGGFTTTINFQGITGAV